MSYAWVEHTAELELHVEAESEEAVFLDTLAAFAELAGAAEGEAQEHELELDAPDRGALLAAWLEELVFLAETERFVPEAADVALSARRLRSLVRGRTGNPPPLVKAVTYHGLVFERRGGLWHARLVLDV